MVSEICISEMCFSSDLLFLGSLWTNFWALITITDYLNVHWHCSECLLNKYCKRIFTAQFEAECRLLNFNPRISILEFSDRYKLYY